MGRRWRSGNYLEVNITFFLFLIQIIPSEAQTELLEQLSGQQKVICSGNATGIQRVEAIAGLDFFWPQLTGRMRVG